MTMRWKKNPRETGLRAVVAGPRGSNLRDGEREYACVYPLGGDWRAPLRGWYWVVPSGGGMPYVNTCNEPVATEDEAKAQAMAYVRAHLKAMRERAEPKAETRSGSGA